MKYFASGLALLSAAACGDPLVGGRYLGTPAFEVGGAVRRPEVMPDAPPQNLRLSLFWIGLDSREMRRPAVEQHTELDSALASFRVTVFDTPPEEALAFEATVAAEPNVGLALIVLYADANENGALNSYSSDPEHGPDTVLGASASHLVAYAHQAVAKDTRAAALLGEIPAGYHLFSNVSGSVCRFARSQVCAGEGTLERVTSPDETVVLTLYGASQDVLVPNPAAPPRSGTGPSNIYGQ